ncbi:MAG: AAA family ATPase [Propioniciclava sp.]
MDEHTTGRIIVTLHEEYGAGAEAIGPLLAQALGVPFVDRAVSSETFEAAAEREAVEENFFERFLSSFTPMPSMEGDVTWALEIRTDHEIAEEGASRLQELVTDGAVVLGRNATIVLAEEPRALHLKLVAPVADRIARAATSAGITPERAQRRQEREDRVRTDLARRLYRWDPTASDNFDIVLNTSIFSPQQVTEIVLAAYRVKYPNGTSS